MHNLGWVHFLIHIISVILGMEGECTMSSRGFESTMCNSSFFQRFPATSQGLPLSQTVLVRVISCSVEKDHMCSESGIIISRVICRRDMSECRSYNVKDWRKCKNMPRKTPAIKGPAPTKLHILQQVSTSLTTRTYPLDDTKWVFYGDSDT